MGYTFVSTYLHNLIKKYILPVHVSFVVIINFKDSFKHFNILYFNYFLIITIYLSFQPAVPTPQPRSRVPNVPNYFPELPELPSVPSDLILPSVPSSNNSNTNASGNDANAPDEIDFEDLNRRFEELKKKK